MLPVVVVTQSEGGGLTARPHLALHHGVKTLRLLRPLRPLSGLPPLPPLGRHVEEGQVGGGEEEEDGGEEGGVEEADLDSLQVEAGDGEVGRQTGGPAGEGLTRRTKLRKERSTLEVRRVGVLNITQITNPGGSSSSLVWCTLTGPEPYYAGAKVYAITTHLKASKMHFVPFGMLLWHDKWLPSMERIYYTSRPYAINTQRKAQNALVGCLGAFRLVFMALRELA